MFNHVRYLNQFLADYKAGRFSNDSVALVERTSAATGYRLIGIHHLTGDENRSRRNLFMEVVDSSGKRLNEKIEWGWGGQRPNEHPNPVVLDKPPNEPAGNISIDWGQKIWARVLDKAGDKIIGITTQLPDDGPWNTVGHHSYYAVWMWLEGGPLPLPPISDDEYERGFEAGEQAVKDRVQEVLDKL